MPYGSKGKAKEDEGEDEISPENAELSLMLKVQQERRKAFKFDREVKDAIRESRRRYSLQRGTRRNDFTTINGMQMNFQRFLKEVRVTSKDEHRFEAIRNKVKFNDKIHKIDGIQGGGTVAGGGEGVDESKVEEIVSRAVGREIEQLMTMLPGMLKMQGRNNSQGN